MYTIQGGFQEEELHFQVSSLDNRHRSTPITESGHLQRRYALAA